MSESDRRAPICIGLLLSLVFVIAGCSPIVSQDEQETAEARQFLNAIVAADSETLTTMVHRDLAAQTLEQVPRMSSWFSDARPEFDYLLTMEHPFSYFDGTQTTGRTIAFEARVTGDRISMRSDRPDEPPFAQWLHADVTFDANMDRPVIVNWTISPATVQPGSVNRFTMSDRSLGHYLFLAAAVTFPLICLAAVVMIWVGPSFHLRWLWTIGSLFGVGQLSLNWTTGAVGFQLLHFQLLGAGYWKAAPLAPTILQIAFPLVAVIFLVWKRNEIAEAAAEAEDDVVDVFNR